jgi:valyl-tRNA synthetase
MIPEDFLKPYDASKTEDETYRRWEESGCFSPEGCINAGSTKPDAPNFSIVLPPPNVTGTLHMGHAAMLAIEDILVRYRRMKGDRVLWVPGTDHAAIATQSKVEKILEKEEGKRRHDLGREEFLKRVNAFAKESHDTIVNQVRKMGSSIDWSREAYTLDEKRNLAVRTAFKQMYDDGLIYRKNKVINWDPKGQTVISDDEIVYEEQKAPLYTFRYSKDFPISISTTRPETKVGDTAVAVHPDDARYAKYVGQTFAVEFCGVPLSIKIIADRNVDPAFGTGALGVTPAHSHIDWQMAEANNLPVIQVIDERGRMSVSAPELASKKIAEARAIIVQWLKDNALLEKEETITNNISKAERTGGIIEPLPKLQWFVAVDKPFTLRRSNIPGISAGSTVTLKQLMRHVVDQKQITILPDRFEKVYFHWIDNLRDWCISRQIWFGHRIPVWYKENQITVGNQPSETGWTQDEDTLDTWFSSGLWTFSTLGWPAFAETASTGKPGPENDFANYHPTSLLETGYDILFFWVARMILMSTYLIGDIPFKTVYLHGLVRDGKGRKMSKSLGNIIDPLDMIAKYGADATRLSLIIGTGPGSDSRLSEDKVRGYKHFANKVWNITRFVLQSTDGIDWKDAPLAPDDEKAITDWHTTLTEITSDIDSYRLYLGAEKMYHYIWHTFADIEIERSKNAINGNDESAKRSASRMLVTILNESLIALHPFMPFVTEEIWHQRNTGSGLLMTQHWPI